MSESGRKVFNMVVAFLVAVAAWVFVVYNYYPMNQVKYASVPVSFKGEKALADRGLAVSSSSLETIAVTLSQKRVDNGSITDENIDVSADVSGCVAGDNSVTLKVSGPSGTKVVSSSASEIGVDVSRIRTEVMDIKVVYGEGADEDEEPVANDLSSVSAEVSCSAELFGRIRSIAAVLDPEDVTENEKSYTIDLKALDSNGEEIPHVVISPDEISLDASAGFTKTVELQVNVNDSSKDDYDRQYTAPDSVTIKGDRDAISNIASISTEEIDISYIYLDEDIDLEYVLPEGVFIADKSVGQKLKLKVSKKESSE